MAKWKLKEAVLVLNKKPRPTQARLFELEVSLSLE